jgi:aerobic C4-dicarboxylate transport protein
MKRSLFRSLYFQVLVAIAAGVLLGVFAPATGAKMKPLGDGFIKLIKMIIAPIIFCTVVLGISGSEDLKKVGRTGGLALLYFEVVSTLALMVGLIIVNVVQPGTGMNVDVRTLDSSAISSYAAPGKMQSTQDFLLNVIPATFFDAFARGRDTASPFPRRPVRSGAAAVGFAPQCIFEIIEKFSEILFAIVGIIMKAAPVGAFGAMAFTVGAYGVGSLLSLAKLMATFYATCLVFIFLVLGSIARVHGFNIFRFLRYIKEELLIVLGTSSSEAALPRMMAKMERLGAGKSTVGLVIPTGYSFNLDGTSIYLTWLRSSSPRPPTRT